MFKLLRRAVGIVMEPRTARALARLRYQGYLFERGWFNAIRVGAPVDAEHGPLPWMTYPFISFLENRLQPSFDVFEFGCGNSTLYFASRVRSIESVEHDKGWYQNLAKSVPANAKLIFEELQSGGAYSKTAMMTGRKYNIILVDGRDRVNCVTNSYGALLESGVIVLDDAERPEYEPTKRFLESHGFRSLPFWGIAPGMTDEKCTAIFYRANNCLGI